MRKVSFLAIALLFTLAIFTSCENALSDPAIPLEEETKWSFSQLSTTEAAEVLQFAFEQYREIKAQTDPRGLEKAGAQFIPPFFTTEGFVITKDIVFGPFGPESGIIAAFETELDGNDFYRENPDGTVSVKISSNNAFAAHLDFATFEEHIGENGKMTMKYDGPIVEVELPFPPYLFRFIDSNLNERGVVWQGTAKVQLFGEGPIRQLSAHLTGKPGGTTIQSSISLK